MLPDYYKILGISINASEDEIKMAFRLRAKRLHPDINPSRNALAQFQVLARAYETLIDPEQRNKYDLKNTFGIEFTPENADSQPKHRDPRYRPGATKAVYAGEADGYVKKVKHERIIWLENTLFISLLIIGLAAMGFAINDLVSENSNGKNNGITGMLFSSSFLIVLIYGWIFYIRKMEKGE